MFELFKALVKKEFIFFGAAFLALISMVVVPPGPAYWGYIDFSVLAILFCLMAVVAGFFRAGIFGLMSAWLLSRSGSLRSLTSYLVGLSFFSSMLITNDVALIALVPLTISTLGQIAAPRLIYIIVLETMAANLGSMLTPLATLKIFISSLFII